MYHRSALDIGSFGATWEEGGPYEGLYLFVANRVSLDVILFIQFACFVSNSICAIFWKYWNNYYMIL